MTASPTIRWSIDVQLLVEFDSADSPTEFRVEGIPGVTRARATIVHADGDAPAGPHLRLRPLTDPPGPFSAQGVLLITPFAEAKPDREGLREFERRIGPRYYEFMLGARYRYAATCSVTASGVSVPGTAAEVYAIDAADRVEAEALDAASQPPDDIQAIYAECRTFIVPGTHGSIWLIPE